MTGPVDNTINQWVQLGQKIHPIWELFFLPNFKKCGIIHFLTMILSGKKQSGHEILYIGKFNFQTNSFN